MYKNPGNIAASSRDHEAITLYAKSLSKRLGISEIAVLGQLIKFDEKMREAMDSKIGMAALKIEVDTGL